MDAIEDHEDREEEQAYDQGYNQGYGQGYDQGQSLPAMLTCYLAKHAQQGKITSEVTGKLLGRIAQIHVPYHGLGFACCASRRLIHFYYGPFVAEDPLDGVKHVLYVLGLSRI